MSTRGEDARLARFDDVLKETGGIAGAGAAGIHECCDAARMRDSAGVDPERRAAPTDMRVKIDEARRDDLSADVAHITAVARRDVFLCRRDFSVRKGHIRHAVEALRRVDHGAARANRALTADMDGSIAERLICAPA